MRCPFISSNPIIYYGDPDICSERNESRTTANSSSRDKNDNKDINIEPARATVTENTGANAVDENEGNVSDWYQATCEGGVAVTSTTVTLSDTRLFLKWVSVVIEPRSCFEDETDDVFDAADSVGIQMGVCSLPAVDDASRDAGGNSLNEADDTSRRIHGNSLSAMIVTRTELRSQQKQQ